MYNLIKSVLDTTGARAIDFDVEGSQISNTALNTRRNNVIKRLQTAYPGAVCLVHAAGGSGRPAVRGGHRRAQRQPRPA